MSKKFIKTTVAALALATGVGTVGTITANTAQPVQAASKSYILNHTTKFKKARILKKTYVRKIHLRTPRYKSTLGPKYYLSKNQIVYVKRLGTDFGWYVKVPGYSGQWTVSGRKLSDTSWFSFNTKVKKTKKKAKKTPKTYTEGFKGNTYTAYNGSKMSFDSITTFDVYVEQVSGKREPQNVRIALLKGTFKNNGKSTTPKKFINANGIKAYTGDSTEIKDSLDFAGYSNPFESDYDEAKEYADLTKSFTEYVDKGDTVTFYAPIGNREGIEKITDTITFADPSDEKTTLKASDNKRLVFLNSERAYRLKNLPNMPDFTPPAHW